jgi:hypothetical protein
MIESNSWPFFKFKLIVTGKGEAKHLPQLFKNLAQTGFCDFRHTEFINQRPPLEKIVIDNRKLVGVPDKDEDIGLKARGFLQTQTGTDIPEHFVILIDDLEYDRRDDAGAVFQRYRSILDAFLTDSQKRRTSVHFLVYMLEAYYFADLHAVNQALLLTPPLTQESLGIPEDVETIRHPKNRLREILNNKFNIAFREIDHGGSILGMLNIPRVLSHPNSCAALRTLFAWCITQLKSHPHYTVSNLPDLEVTCHLDSGLRYSPTRSQIQ